MPGENILDWSTTAASNGNADSSINFSEGQPRASVNNSARSMMAAHAKDRNLKNGSIITGGSANAQSFFSGLDYTTMPTGLRVTLKIGPGLTNTSAATLEMDGRGAIAVKNQLGLDISPGALFAGTYNEFIYNGTNWIAMAASAGALENIRVFLVTGTYPATTSTCKVLVMCKGGGGCGGGSANTIFGGGGGEGAISWKLTTAATLSGLAVTVGAGGIFAYPTAGTGGESSIGTIVTAPGGLGGQAGDTTLGVAGVGGFGGTNDWGEPGIPGSGGGSGIVVTSGGGRGGGAGRSAGRANSGGGGAGSDSAMVGGLGGSGIVVCYEYGII